MSKKKTPEDYQRLQQEIDKQLREQEEKPMNLTETELSVLLQQAEEDMKLSPEELAKKVEKSDEMDVDGDGVAEAKYEFFNEPYNPKFEKRKMRTDALHDYTPEEIQRVIEQSRTSARATSASAMDEVDFELFNEEEKRGGRHIKRKTKKSMKKRSKTVRRKKQSGKHKRNSKRRRS